MAKIGLDYGHGKNTFPPSKGVYKGGVGYHEHDFNSKLGLKIKALLKANGHTVVEGQPAYGNEVGLTSRTNLYNREGVDIVISVHANANSNKEVQGRCVFYWHSSSEGRQLAEMIVKEIKDAGYSTHGNGLHASRIGSWTNLHITRETDMPAVLVEYGFMSNDLPGINDDFELLFGSKQEAYTDEMAAATVKAVQNFFGQSFKGGVTSPSKTSHSNTSKPSETGVKWVGTNDKGKELIVDTASLNYYDTQRWSNPSGAKKRGFKWKIDNLYRVNGSLQYRVQDANGRLFYTSARSDLVKIGGEYGATRKPTPIRGGTLPNATYYVKNPPSSRFNGSGVRAVQEALASVHFYPKKGSKNNGIDGWYGPDTADAVKRFQSVHGLKADGIYGAATRSKLEQVRRNN